MNHVQGSRAVRDGWEHIDVHIADSVAQLTFRRADRLGALTFAAYADLRDVLGELSLRDDVRCAVITGSGRGFCSGGDVEDIIGALQDMDVRQRLDFTRMTGAVVQAMRDCPLPIIAAVNGVAAGAGAVIALAADLRLLSRSASFAFLFTKVGLAGADMGSAYLLPRIVGLGHASELLMLGGSVDADHALHIGLASRVVDDDALMPETAVLARDVASGPALAYAATKVLLSRELDMDLAASLELDAMTQALLMRSDDHVEFYRAWQEHRAPRWRGR